MTQPNDRDAARLHRESIVIDGLNASYFLDERVFQRLRKGGVTAVNATVAAWHSPAETLALLGDVYAIFDRCADLVVPVRTVADIATAKASDRVGVILGFQDTAPIAENLRLLAVYRALGVRVIQLTYNARNAIGAGCLVPDDSGLTEFGRTVVAEMNRLGILIDLSHCGPRTTLDAIAESAGPVAITHANPRSRCDHPRNKSDEALKALAARGGVVGAVVFPLMVTGAFNATLDDYLATIEYLVDLVGIDHVGIGPDFMEEMPRAVALQALAGMPPETQEMFLNAPPMRGLESIALCAEITRGLLARGYGTEDTRKIVGGNWLRLYTAAWHA